VDTLRGKLDEVREDLSSARVQLKRASSNNFEQENNLLEIEVHRLKREIELLQKHTKEYAALKDKVIEYEHDNDKLRHKLKAYVDRCDKLESSKLTKDKLEAIKKLMVSLRNSRSCTCQPSIPKPSSSPPSI
jgi:molecular chaperone GrpE (heat shock protein)